MLGQVWVKKDSKGWFGEKLSFQHGIVWIKPSGKFVQINSFRFKSKGELEQAIKKYRTIGYSLEE